MSDLYYAKNRKIELTIEREKITHPVYEVGFKLVYTPVSELFKKEFYNYLKYLANITGQNMNSHLKAQKKGQDYIQKRKEARFKPSTKIPMMVMWEGEVLKIMDISLNGLRVQTSKKIRFGDKVLLKLRFENHQIDIYGDIRFINVMEQTRK